MKLGHQEGCVVGATNGGIGVGGRGGIIDSGIT